MILDLASSGFSVGSSTFLLFSLVDYWCIAVYTSGCTNARGDSIQTIPHNLPQFAALSLPSHNLVGAWRAVPLRVFHAWNNPPAHAAYS